MKGYRFYLEYPNKTEKNKATVKNPGNHDGNVVAIVLEDDGRPIGHIEHHPNDRYQFVHEGFSAVFYHPNSDVNFGGIGRPYLQERCKRIPERLAREIHPRLFDRLES